MAQDFVSDSSRRTFLTVAGVGAVGIAAATVAAPRLLSGSGSGTGSTGAPSVGSVGDVTALPNDISGSLIAVVKDVNVGLVSVLVGEHEVVIHDREIVARLAQAASKGATKAGG